MKYLYKILFAGALLLFGSIPISAQLSQPIDFLLPSNMAAANVSAAEYYFDTDPGLGKGNSISITPGADVSANNIPVNISSLSAGVHRLFVRTKNTNNLWSLSNVATFFIIPPDALFPPNANVANVTAAECFFDMDPGFSKGFAIPVTTGADVSVSNFGVEIDTLSVGVHRFYVRTKNSNGKWSIANIASFYIIQGSSFFPANPAITNVSSAEYFIDTDPGIGKGTSIPIIAGADVSASNIAVTISSLANGVHHIYVRTQNTKGQWSITNVSSFLYRPG